MGKSKNNLNSFIFDSEEYLKDDLKSYELNNNLLHSKFIENAKNYPEWVALINEEKVMSYGELYTLSYTLAKNIIAKKNTRIVGVFLEKGWEQVVAVLGILQTGSAYLPIDINMPLSKIINIIEIANIDLIITKSEYEDIFKEAEGIKIMNIDNKYDSSNEEIIIDSPLPNDIAYVIFTSGTTGNPKGVMIKHNSAINTIQDINEKFKVSKDDRLFALSSLSFDLSVYDIFGILSAGATMVIPNHLKTRDPSHWFQLLSSEKITIWNSVPALMDIFLDYLEEKNIKSLDFLRLSLISGDWIPLKLPDRIKSLNSNSQIVSLGGLLRLQFGLCILKLIELMKIGKAYLTVKH
ncbi:AMP-binding protein [Virgibacillus sp. NKC19-3]|nr:AMP-binding protein [Virgibacillus sp. NKC19-3]